MATQKSKHGIPYQRHSIVSLTTPNSVVRIESLSRMVDGNDIEAVLDELVEMEGRPLTQVNHEIAMCVNGAKFSVRSRTFRI